MSEWDTYINVEEDLIKANTELANENADYFKKRGMRVFEVLGNIGSGKTSVIECVVAKLKDKYKIVVVNGDLATSIDADRIKKHNVSAIQINTGKECHLDALTIKPVFDQFPEGTNLCFIENIGNLICPMDFRLGAEKRIVVFSISNGPYIVRKHPISFLETDVVIINKVDLAEYLEFSEEDKKKLEEDCKKINPKLQVVFTSAKTKEGIDDLIKILKL
ncbi:MAG: hydrogenase nickel incorporation protein HypB [Candidatus Helarchaeota archaeon]